MLNEQDLTAIAEGIVRLWRECGGYGPPHRFDVQGWRRGTHDIRQRYELSSTQWCRAHQMAVNMGAQRWGV